MKWKIKVAVWPELKIKVIVFFLWKGAQEVLFQAKCCGPWFLFCCLLNSTSRPAVQAKQLAFQGSAHILQYYYKEKKEKLLWHCHSCCRMKACLSNSGVSLSEQGGLSTHHSALSGLCRSIACVPVPCSSLSPSSACTTVLWKHLSPEHT